MGGTHTIADESLSRIIQSVDGAGDGVVLKVNHMGWYRLKSRVASMKCIVW